MKNQTKYIYPRDPTDPMPIDYIAESDKYRPDNIQTLLVGEAPPPNRTSYIYVPENMRNAQNVQNDRSLPATIFNHYFGRRPADKNEYRDFLLRLKKLGVFIVDIYDQPIKVRNNQKGLEKIVMAIPKLRGKLRDRGILVDEKRMIFLLARKNYYPSDSRELSECKIGKMDRFSYGWKRSMNRKKSLHRKEFVGIRSVSI